MNKLALGHRIVGVVVVRAHRMRGVEGHADDEPARRRAVAARQRVDFIGDAPPAAQVEIADANIGALGVRGGQGIFKPAQKVGVDVVVDGGHGAGRWLLFC